MAYTTDVLALSPNHSFSFSASATDSVGALASTNTGMLFTGTPICEDVVNSMKTSTVTDLLELGTTAFINQERERILVSGWFMIDSIQQPPCRILGDGGVNSCFAFHIGFGNQILYEVDNVGFTLQIYGDTPLVTNRPYHLTLRFESSSFGNLFKAYLDGVEQTNTTDNTPDSNLGVTRTAASFGGKASTLALGGTALKIVTPVSCFYNHWAFWGGASGQAVTDTQIRTELFEKGALATSEILSDTQANMQTALDLLSTTRTNVPLDVRIQDVLGSGDLNLNISLNFDPKTSIHVQWLGTGTLTLTNINSNTSIVSAPNGNVVIINPRTLSITGIPVGSVLSIYDDNIVDYANFNDRLEYQPSTTTSFDFLHNGLINDIIIEIIHVDYEEIIQPFTIGDFNQTLEIFPKKEIN